MDLIFKKAGRLELFRYRDKKTFLFPGVIQSITSSITQNTTDLEDGNSDWALIYSTNKSGQVVFNLNSFQPRLYAALLAAEYGLNEDFVMRRIETFEIPDDGTYEVELEHLPEVGTIVVHDDADEPFAEGTVEPEANEYIVAGKKITFNEADAGKEVVVAYDAEIPSYLTELPAKTNLDVFRVTIAGEATSRANEGVTKPDVMIFDRVRASGEISPPPRQNTPQGWSTTFSVLEPRKGHKVVSYAVGK